MDWFIENILGLENSRMEGAVPDVRFLQSPKIWIIVLILVPLTIGLVGWFYRREKGGLGRGSRVFLSAVRLLIVWIILLMIFEPMLFLERSLEQRSTVIVLLDESKSMSFVDKIVDLEERQAVADAIGVENPEEVTELSRMDIMNRALSRDEFAFLETLREKNNVAIFAFAGGIRTLFRGTAKELENLDEDTGEELSPEEQEKRKNKIEFEALTPVGGVTQVGDAVYAALNELRGQKVVGAVVFSDGQENGGQDAREIARELQKRRIPIFTVAPGSPQPPRNIHLVKVQVPDVAIAKDTVVADVEFTSHGYEGRRVNLVVVPVSPEGEEGRELARQAVELDESLKIQDVKLSWQPQEAGEFTLLFKIIPEPDELTDEDNFESHRIRVVDNKVRVLLIEGSPRWEYRYLKNALLRDDDTVDVQCLLTSSDPDFPQEASPGLDGLLEFPGSREELFKNYDVIVIGDVRPKDFRATALGYGDVLTTIRDFVYEGGGGVLFIAGTHDNPRSYRDTALEPLLPVELEPDPSYNRLPEVITQTFQPELTPQGRQHPITMFGENPAESEQIWKSLEPMYWSFKALQAKQGATVLAQHPFETSRMGPRPLMAIQHYGRGRTMWAGFDSAWRWRRYYNARYPYQMWRQAISWLRKGRVMGSNRFRVETDKPEYDLGETVTLDAEVFTPEFKPMQADTVTCMVELPNGEQEEVELKAKREEVGKFRGTFKSALEGEYRVWIGDEMNEADRDDDLFRVKLPNKEFDNPTMNKELLMDIAAFSGGKYFPIQELNKVPDTVQARRLTLTVEQKEEPLWDTPLFYILFALLITIEWIARKMKRLL